MRARITLVPYGLSLIVVFLVGTALSMAVPAELAGQRVSPHETVSATIDGADLSITYGRPSMRGRTIMGTLVSYGHVWCPGADEATTLTTSRPMRIGSMSLSAGSYTFWMLPSADAWTLIVNTQTGQWHTRYDPQYDLGRIELQKASLAEAIEQLTFAIDKNPTGAGGVLKMMWERTAVSAQFSIVQ